MQKNDDRITNSEIIDVRINGSANHVFPMQIYIYAIVPLIKALF